MIESLLLEWYSSKNVPIATLIGLLEQCKHHVLVIWNILMLYSFRNVNSNLYVVNVTVSAANNWDS